MKNISRLTAIASLLCVALAAQATPPWSTPGEIVAIQGYDSVGYFTKSDAIRGSSKFSLDWNGMTWFFSTAENRDMFAAAPEKYAPQFGGFCTVSIANGRNSRGSGEAWTIHKGKLYLSYDKQVRARLLGGADSIIETAERWWPGVKAAMEKE